MPRPVNPELQVQAAAMFTEILSLPADGATVADSFIDYENRDLGFDIDVPVASFMGQRVTRVTVSVVLPQTNFYNGAPHNLSTPEVVTVSVPNDRNFGPRNQPVGALEIKAGKVTANVAAFAAQGESGVLVSHNSSEHREALTALMDRLMAASGVEDRLRGR